MTKLYGSTAFCQSYFVVVALQGQWLAHVFCRFVLPSCIDWFEFWRKKVSCLPIRIEMLY